MVLFFPLLSKCRKQQGVVVPSSIPTKMTTIIPFSMLVSSKKSAIVNSEYNGTTDTLILKAHVTG